MNDQEKKMKIARETCTVTELAEMSGLSRGQTKRYLECCGVPFHKVGRSQVVTLVDLARRTPGLLKSLLIMIPILESRARRASGAVSAAT